MQKWEYASITNDGNMRKIHTRERNSGPVMRDRSDLISALNSFGEEGYELTVLVPGAPGSPDDWTLILKRSKQ